MKKLEGGTTGGRELKSKFQRQSRESPDKEDVKSPRAPQPSHGSLAQN